VLRQLLDECVRVIQVDPFDGNDLAKQLVSKSERYRSGYWLLKMYVWRAMEYSKVAFLDGDIYFRHNPDALFCAPTPPKKVPPPPCTHVNVQRRSERAGHRCGVTR
jgi:alpha-N-acetylglucosamine transferase